MRFWQLYVAAMLHCARLNAVKTCPACDPGVNVEVVQAARGVYGCGGGSCIASVSFSYSSVCFLPPSPSPRCRHGFHTTFVPKMNTQAAGSGCHCHFSLWRVSAWWPLSDWLQHLTHTTTPHTAAAAAVSPPRLLCLLQLLLCIPLLLLLLLMKAASSSP